jgi:hypothetical protein
MAKRDPRLEKWLRWLNVIKLQVRDLVMAKYTFHEIQKMIAANPTIQKDNSFYRYLTNTYVSHVVIGLRRQLKLDSQSISLVLLMQELIATPEVLSRTYFKGLYAGSVVEDRADGDFDKFSKAGAAHIDPDLIAADLSRLRSATVNCEEFADKRVAHHDKRDPKQLPTFNEVDAAIDLLDELYCRYLLMFEAKSMSSLLPTWQYDWKEIFRVPWIAGK